tara:strand:+ start:16910 stop:17074 length:165 start_codon:yes stop_codon:yes gene_type:complete
MLGFPTMLTQVTCAIHAVFQTRDVIIGLNPKSEPGFINANFREDHVLGFERDVR